MTLPLTLASAAAAIQDGTLGLIETVSIGDVIVSALIGLDGGDWLDVTSRPIESGLEITECAIATPVERTLTVCLANPDFSAESGLKAALEGSVTAFTETWRDKRDRLYKYFTDREIIELTTHENFYENMLIYGIAPFWDVDENYNCFFAQVSLRQITTVNEAATGIIDSTEDMLGGL